MNKISDNNDFILVLAGGVDGKNFILICEVEQLKTLSKVTQMPTTLQFTQKSHIIFSGDFNLFSNVHVKSYGGRKSSF